MPAGCTGPTRAGACAELCCGTAVLSWKLLGLASCCARFFPVRIYARRVHRSHKSWRMCRAVLWDSRPQLEVLRAGKLLCGVLPGEDTGPTRAGACVELCCGTAVLSWKLLTALVSPYSRRYPVFYGTEPLITPRLQQNRQGYRHDPLPI